MLRYGLLTAFMVFVWGCFLTQASAQCPKGAPPLPNGKCPGGSGTSSGSRTASKKRARTAEPRSAGLCSIAVEVSQRDGGKVQNVELVINGKRNGMIRTNLTGKLFVNGLSCDRRYDLRPVKNGVKFEPATSAIPSLKGQARIEYLASTHGKPEPTQAPVEAELEPTAPPPAPAAPPCNPSSSPMQSLSPGESAQGVVSPQLSECDRNTGAAYFNDYFLKGVLGGDKLLVEIRSPQLEALDVQILDVETQAVKPEDESERGEMRSLVVALPESSNGDAPFRLRVRNPNPFKVEYSLNLSKKGMSVKAFEQMLRQAISAMTPQGESNFYEALNYNLARMRDEIDWKTRDAADKRMKKATELLEGLAESAPENPQPHEMLSAIYLYHRRDPLAAIPQREQAIQLKGAVGFRVKIGDNFVAGKQGEKIETRNEECWLLIREGRLSCESFTREFGEVFKAAPGLTDRAKFMTRKSDLTLKLIGTRRYARRNRKEEVVDETRDRELFLAPISGNKDEAAAIQETINRLIFRRSSAR